MRRYMELLYGNSESKQSLCRAALQNTLPHALIIEGIRGSGKKTFAKEIASAQLCENKTSTTLPLPCKSCRSCRIIADGNAVDVKWITRGDKATLGVDAVREAKQDMYLSATEFDTKFYVFDEAHLMTPQAQNALLIVLEEPPPTVKILLLCESADALLTTVRSRARLVRMNKFTVDEIENWLRENRPDALARYSADPSALADLLTESDGSIGRALEILEPKNAESVLKDREHILKLIDAFSSPSFAVLHDAVSRLSAKRDDLTTDLTLLTRALRDLILLKKTPDAPLCFFGERDAALKKASAFRLSFLLRAMQNTEDAIRKLERNANAATVLNVFKCTMKNS